MMNSTISLTQMGSLITDRDGTRAMKEESSHRYNFIDLFAGAGGLSEGFIQAGFSPVAHIEMVTSFAW